ncbi:MAG: response regulator, partial [Candidatus Nanopelagicaceae bacterium]
DFTRSVTVDAHGEVAELKHNVNEMIRNLRETTEKNSEQDWLKSNLARLNRALQGQRDLTMMSEIVLSELAPLVDAQHGVFYIMNESPIGEARLQLLSAYAYKERKNVPKEWKIGEGLVGQCAVEKKRIMLTNIPNDYIRITSGLGEAKPLNIMVQPIIFEGKVKGIIELASFTQFSSTQMAFLDQFAESVGIVINTIEINMRTEELLKQSQTLTDELQSQQEELRETNQELEENAQLLEEQKLEVETKNREVEQAKTAVEEKASQLELTSKYKSEFLSNMSHELRTPLNSLLILAEHLAANPKSHLDAKEVEFAKLIHVSGNDLLSLINEILDLSKIESGTVLVDRVSVPIASIQEQIENTFRYVARDRGLDFEITFARDLPSVIVTDEMRLLQVMKNLLSNAFKFTDKGKVSVRVDRILSGWNVENTSLNGADEVIAFTVEDTGVGISDDKQRLIFEAFQQGDGRTARKYGGTGLGLSISREIARILGGELALVRSTANQGSVFALYLPQNTIKGGVLETSPDSDQSSHQVHHSNSSGANATHEALSAIHESTIADDRDLIEGDRVLLIVEDDPTFAKIILDLAREKGFKGIVAMRGSQALELARNYKPDAITLDIHIPDIDGWAILDALKRDSDLRHIPVDVITVEDYPLRALSQGAFKYLTKPVSHVQLAKAIEATRTFLDRPMKNLLLVAGDKIEDRQITEQLGNGDITVHHARSGKLGLIEMGKKSFDCVVVATKLADMSVADFITAMRKNELLEEIPVVVFSGTSITDSDRDEIEKLGTASVVRSADSLDRLLDQTALFLHRVVSHLPEEKRKLLQQLHQATNNLGGKKVLIVDDDARNIFALTPALESRGVIVSSAENGVAAIDLLRKAPDIDLVLMDIMMPGMDGYETTREIRKLAKFRKLPIIALTAKAMVGDREKCLDAGASDYLSKPVNIEQLSSLMQVWLSR